MRVTREVKKGGERVLLTLMCREKIRETKDGIKPEKPEGSRVTAIPEQAWKPNRESQKRSHFSP